MGKIKEMFKSVNSRYGIFSTAKIAIVIAIVVLVNLLAGQMPKRFKNIDLSESNIYDITDTSKTLLKKLDKEVELHVLAEEATTDERIKTFIDKYAGLSKKLSVKWTDPTLHPTVFDEYDAEMNSIVVTCAETEKQTMVLFNDIIVYQTDPYSGYLQESAFDGEGQLTSAVNYVTSDVAKTIYRTTGHGESTFSTTISDLMEKSNFAVSELNTIMKNEIPEDCDLLFMNAPTTDITTDERTLISEYLTEGGKFFLLLGSTDKQTPNLDGLMKEYGMERVKGYIADENRNLQGEVYYILPELTLQGDMANGISSQMVLLIGAYGMKEVTPERDTITLNGFMKTSENAYAVASETESVKGTYTLGAVATEGESRFTVITAASMIHSSLTDSGMTFENTTLFMNAVSDNFEEVVNVAIEPKSLQLTYNTMKYVGVSSLVVVFGIPLVVLVYGFVIWLKRKKA